jgi:hypothetical protein
MLRKDFSDDANSGLRTFVGRADGIEISPTTPAVEKPEKGFLFNPSKSKEQFIRNMIAKLEGSIQRRYTKSD